MAIAFTEQFLSNSMVTVATTAWFAKSAWTTSTYKASTSELLSKATVTEL